MIACGNASGKPPLLDVLQLAKGSLTVCRPTLFDYVATREEFLERATEVFDWLSKGIIGVQIAAKFPLKDALEAHKFIEGIQSTILEVTSC